MDGKWHANRCSSGVRLAQHRYRFGRAAQRGGSDAAAALSLTPGEPDARCADARPPRLISGKHLTRWLFRLRRRPLLTRPCRSGGFFQGLGKGPPNRLLFYPTTSADPPAQGAGRGAPATRGGTCRAGLSLSGR